MPLGTPNPMSTSNAPGSPDLPDSPESPASLVPDRPGQESQLSFAGWTTRRALGAAVVVLLGFFLVVWAVHDTTELGPVDRELVSTS
ncbi:MAG TPA: hypothetical protein PLV92_19290, partial [Pirellulaceae bacterium]|nr:hypothetical protein [Pirellulaceae bacterium]